MLKQCPLRNGADATLFPHAKALKNRLVRHVSHGDLVISIPADLNFEKDCNLAFNHKDEAGREVWHIKANCRSTARGVKCPLGSECTFGHDYGGP